MEKMGIKDTQYIIGRHFDKEHPHVHIAFNRIDNNGKTISDRNDQFRSEKMCKELTAKYGLYFAGGKEKVKEYRLKEPDKTKYEIYQALKAEIARCRDWTTLLSHLKEQDIDVRFKYKGNSQDVQGVIFEKNGYHFNGSKVDRSFSYSKIDFALQQNNREHDQQMQETTNLISNIADVTSEITNDLIEGGLGLFQTHGTVPAEVYNTLDKNIIHKTKRSEKIKRSVMPRKTKRSFSKFPPHNAKRLRFLWGVCSLFFITFQTFKSNFTLSSPSSNNLVRSKLFSYICTFPRFSVIFFSGRSICRAMR